MSILHLRNDINDKLPATSFDCLRVGSQLLSSLLEHRFSWQLASVNLIPLCKRTHGVLLLMGDDDTRIIHITRLCSGKHFRRAMVDAVRSTANFADADAHT